MDYSNIDSVIETMYSVISGPAGKPRDWALLRSLYHPQARLMVAPHAGNQALPLRVMTVDEFIARLEKIFATESFWERETKRHVEQFGRIAHVVCDYESFHEEHGPPFTSGRKSMQMFNEQTPGDGTRWWVVSAMWNTERAE
jgi:hypothetical protein